MTNFLDKAKMLEKLGEMRAYNSVRLGSSVENRDYSTATIQQARGMVEEAINEMIKDGDFDIKPDRGSLLKQASTKDLIAELKTRPAVQVKEFLDIREGDTWRISGDVPTIVITVADIWGDRS